MTNHAWWTIPDYEEIHWFNEANERATIKSIVDGTSFARTWGDIQSTWPWCRKPKSHIPRVEKKRIPRQRPNIRLVRILQSNGVSRKEAIQMAFQLMESK